MDVVEVSLKEALAKINEFIVQITGREPSQEILARALKRYFILNEIKTQVEWEWQNETDGDE